MNCLKIKIFFEENFPEFVVTQCAMSCTTVFNCLKMDLQRKLSRIATKNMKFVRVFSHEGNLLYDVQRETCCTMYRGKPAVRCTEGNLLYDVQRETCCKMYTS